MTISAASIRADDGGALARVQQAERQRVDLIARVSPAAICVLTNDKSSGGSGVMISPDGYGLTNFHVVLGLGDISKGVTGLAGLSDGTTCPLEILGIDPTGDLAMFRVKGRERFDYAQLGDSDRLHVGEEVVALGNPFMLAEDYRPTATFGIVSGLHRYQFGADARSLVYTDCIQIDASINPGNSGGPLFDMQGHVVGINGRASFKHDLLKARINVGVAYAISINQIKRFIPALRNGWLVEHGTLGATVADTPAGNVLFNQVLPRSAADVAGLRVGDELLALDGRRITSANAMLNLIGVYPAGWPVEVSFRRDGDEHRRKVYLDPLTLPGDAPMKKADPLWIRASASQPAMEAERDALPATATETSYAIPTGVVRIYGAKGAGQRGFATGVLVSDAGQVAAPLALLLETPNLRVVTADGRVHPAIVEYRDEKRQLALLKVRDWRQGGTEGGQPLRIEAGIAPAAGDTVFVVGNPFKIAEGDEPCSVTRGVLAGRIQLDAQRPGGSECAYRGEVLIVDAMVSNPGSPGSAVLDAQGRWIGLVGETLESRRTHTLLNYAYPIGEVATFLQEARGEKPAVDAASSAPARQTPGYHGIRLSRIGFRSQLPFVDAVAADSPAATAGVARGDLLMSANGTTIARSQAFDELCRQLHAGDKLSLVLKRGDDIKTVELKLAEVPR